MKDVVSSLLPKHPVLSPRPIARISRGRKPWVVVHEPRSGVIAYYDITRPNLPLTLLSMEGNEAFFNPRSSSPRFVINLKDGKIQFDDDGVTIKRESGSQVIPWTERKEIIHLIVELALEDEVFRSIGVRIGDGLRKASSTARRARFAVIPESGSGPSPGDHGVIPDPVDGVIHPPPIADSTVLPPPIRGCTDIDIPRLLPPEPADDALTDGIPYEDCMDAAYEDMTEECLEEQGFVSNVSTKPVFLWTSDCKKAAQEEKERCEEWCDEHYVGVFHFPQEDDPQPHIHDLPACLYVCQTRYEQARGECHTQAMACFIPKIPELVNRCETDSGWMPGDQPPHDFSVRIYLSENPLEESIDGATCGYGYGKTAFVDGNSMFHSDGPNFLETPLTSPGSSKYAVIRFGTLTGKVEQLTGYLRKYVRSFALLHSKAHVVSDKPKSGNIIDAGEVPLPNLDLLEVTTFKTYKDPGREIGTLILMSGLDYIGVDRGRLGLDGFVSPNDIARRMGAPIGWKLK